MDELLKRLDVVVVGFSVDEEVFHAPLQRLKGRASLRVLRKIDMGDNR